jgi:hypothetical protein
LHSNSNFTGHVIYTGAYSSNPNSTDPSSLVLFLLPSFTSADHYATIQVRIPAEFLLLKSNVAIKARALWGSKVYTDDSDIVAILGIFKIRSTNIVHSGLYKPIDFTENDWQLEKPNLNAKLPDHDLYVNLRILPRLLRYQGSNLNGISSRSWGSLHDGESIKIINVTQVPRGSVLNQGRKVGAKAWVEGKQGDSLIEEDAVHITFANNGDAYFRFDYATFQLQWESKMKQAVLELESEDGLYEISWQQFKYCLKKNGRIVGFTSSDGVCWSEKGCKFVDRDISVIRYCWKNSV